MVVVRATDADLSGPTRADLARWGDASELWVPMVYQDEVLGLLSTSEVSAERRYTEDEQRLAAGIAVQAAAALQNARAYERLEQERVALARLNRRLSAFAELSGQMRGLLSEERLIDLLGRVMHGALEFNQWVIYLYDPDHQLFRVAKAFGGTPEIDEHYATTPIPVAVMNGLLGSARIMSQSYFVDHLQHTWTDEENFYLPGEELVGERPEGEWNQFDSLFVPMTGQKNQLIGYIEAYDPLDRQRPTDEVVRLIEVFASKAASNIELQRAYGELEQQSRTDGLTGLYNHRFFQERLTAETARAQRFDKKLTLLMIDVDNFKEFNDAYGHPQGDRLLKSLADLLLAQTRANVDFVARYGGEEFVVLLPETGVGDAAAAAERLQESFEGQRPAMAVAEAIRVATQEQTFDTAGDKARSRDGQRRSRHVPRPRLDRRPARGQRRQGALHGQAPGQEPHQRLRLLDGRARRRRLRRRLLGAADILRRRLLAPATACAPHRHPALVGTLRSPRPVRDSCRTAS